MRAGVVEGCRPHELFGVWAVEESRFRRMLELAKGADLAQLRAESRAAVAAAAALPPYQMTPDGLAVVDLSGPLTKYPTSFQALLGGTSTLAARKGLRAAARSDLVSGIMLRIDSPGGTVSGTSELAEEIRQAAARKPLFTFADDLAASAGLLALSQGGRVWANPNAEVGSIGVYMVVEDTSQAYAQAGVKVHVVSSAPPLKGAGEDGSPVTDPQLDEWRRRVGDTAAWFVGEVARGRRMTTGQVSALATGQVWIAHEARRLGLVDDVGTFDEAMAALQSGADRVLEARGAERRRREAHEESAKRARAQAARVGPARVAAPSAPRVRTSADVLGEIRRLAPTGAVAEVERLTREYYALGGE